MARPLVFCILLNLYINDVCPLDVMKYSFVKKGLRCMGNITVYRKQSYESRTFCTVACIEDNCDKFTWDSDNQTCLFHSDKDNVSPAISIHSGWKMYRRTLKDVCGIVGYEFFPTLDMCYKIYDSMMATWVNAQQMCQDDGGNLVSISSLETLKEIIDLLKCGRMWVGLRNDRWLNGQPFVNIFGPSTYLDNDDLQVPWDTDNTCGSIVQKEDDVYVTDNSCYIRERDYFICEINSGL